MHNHIKQMLWNVLDFLSSFISFVFFIKTLYIYETSCTHYETFDTVTLSSVLADRKSCFAVTFCVCVLPILEKHRQSTYKIYLDEKYVESGCLLIRLSLSSVEKLSLSHSFSLSLSSSRTHFPLHMQPRLDTVHCVGETYNEHERFA